MLVGAMSVSILLQGCASREQPFHFGKDKCDHCRMTIFEPGFVAEIVLKTGKAYKFDDVACLLNFLKTNPLKEPDRTQIRVANFADPEGNFLDARAAFFVKSETYKSPMAGNMAAFADGKAANAKLPPGAAILKWDELFSQK